MPGPRPAGAGVLAEGEVLVPLPGRMRIITANVNGLRAAADKGFIRWMQRQKADVVCVQEVKAQEHQLQRPIARPKGYIGYFADAKRPGYSGVGVYCRREPDRVIRGFGWEDIDEEGRLIRVDFGRLSVLSLYIPSGSSSEERQRVKYDLMDRMIPLLRKLACDGRDYVICGDWNIAHKAIDLRNWRSNQDHSGFLPEERAWMDRVFGDLGWSDAFRKVNDQPDEYTFWSSRGQAWANNTGWRIDYQVVSAGLADKVVEASVYKKRRFSDHAPVTIDYAYAL